MSVALKQSLHGLVNIVLKKAIFKLGFPGDVVKVKPGFAFNFLIPKGLALFANETNMAEFESKKEELMKEHEVAKNLALNVKEMIEAKAVFLERPINDAGNFYSVINATEVSAALNEQFGNLNFTFDKNHILISNKIRNYGTFDATISLYNGVSAKIKLIISANRKLAEEAFNAPKEIV
jgi:large subunit ribosomal protein L9